MQNHFPLPAGTSLNGSTQRSAATLTIPEMKGQARTFSNEIWTRWQLLRDVVERHEATIQKRWAKKTKAQRLQILLRAWPGMPEGHRPDFWAFRKEGVRGRLVRPTAYRFHYLAPYINQEDLCKPRALMLMLNSRARNLPPLFASIDGRGPEYGMITGAIPFAKTQDHTMLVNFFTEETMHMYGTLLSWKEHAIARQWVESNTQFGPGQGLLVLEIQARVLGFLLDCCQQLLHDFSPDTWITNYPVQPEPQLKEGTGPSAVESLAVFASESPYLLPSKLDMAKIESLLAAEASAAEDTLWALREDPIYFYEYLMDHKEHRQELIRDQYGQLHPDTQGRTDRFWSRILRMILVKAFIHIEVYTVLKQQAQTLRLLQEKYAKVVNRSQNLPMDYLAALFKFRHFLTYTLRGTLIDLEGKAAASPPFRDVWVRLLPEDLHKPWFDTEFELVERTTQLPTPEETHLFWLINQLREEGGRSTLSEVPVIVDELERLVLAEPAASRRISSNIAGVIGELSVLTQCLQQLHRYNFWSKMGGRKLEYESYVSEFNRTGEPFATIHMTTHFATSVALLEPFKTKPVYPIERARTKANVELLRTAEANLDAFWDSIDRVIAERAADVEGTTTMRLLSTQRVLQRTPEWVEPFLSVKKGAEQPQPVLSIYEPMSRLLANTAPERDAGPIIPKVKTRGVPGISDPESDATVEESDVPRQVYEVDARTLKVFRNLFYTPDISATPGEIPWLDFCHALTSVGFSAVKGYGSVWNFYPAGLEVERPIQFHEPHPMSKIPYKVARRHGRRLHRAYGWDRDSFVLKGGARK